ncbi:hypothetical protein PHYBLDRAFT_175442 [Phycomyces blakesleeanus NRRL 1555(-)]|uniref:Uncharacterized protein n=1 Tax=Phycomyces blakesleeanus (strain ATCC 8743b / DSM 1359 / FGSC 10004 / NBRC 33097 / NRRL 1555) TaxID=763407 RepID=A0A167JJX9_PHYB8|nr:hypothetical protein PHYBLDRAFT_175442 [Phycomyces blakesleeanus NRRL 1555(-)]OAD66146.1 hypothetical protein PHYBLDRAFT_175442 [Phycomyces blakesleeanus NRRL 1555(-)]|eukprot:XP_018284186.1 hypothetical protein PHYBLDRAFT_175442 [Phycomyces blakesleeanus NRRL 1555(-)]
MSEKLEIVAESSFSLTRSPSLKEPFGFCCRNRIRFVVVPPELLFAALGLLQHTAWALMRSKSLPTRRCQWSPRQQGTIWKCLQQFVGSLIEVYLNPLQIVFGIFCRPLQFPVIEAFKVDGQSFLLGAVSSVEVAANNDEVVDSKMPSIGFGNIIGMAKLCIWVQGHWRAGALSGRKVSVTKRISISFVSQASITFTNLGRSPLVLNKPIFSLFMGCGDWRFGRFYAVHVVGWGYEGGGAGDFSALQVVRDCSLRDLYPSLFGREMADDTVTKVLGFFCSNLDGLFLQLGICDHVCCGWVKVPQWDNLDFSKQCNEFFTELSIYEEGDMTTNILQRSMTLFAGFPSIPLHMAYPCAMYFIIGTALIELYNKLV